MTKLHEETRREKKISDALQTIVDELGDGESQNEDRRKDENGSRTDWKGQDDPCVCINRFPV